VGARACAALFCAVLGWAGLGWAGLGCVCVSAAEVLQCAAHGSVRILAWHGMQSPSEPALTRLPTAAACRASQSTLPPPSPSRLPSATQVRARLAAQKKKASDKKVSLSAAALAEAKARKAKEKKKKDKSHHNQVRVCVRGGMSRGAWRGWLQAKFCFTRLGNATLAGEECARVALL